MKVYLTVKGTWNDPWDNQLPCQRITAVADITRTEARWPRDTGYGIQKETVWRDGTNLFFAYTPIDYHGRTRYRDSVGRFWRQLSQSRGRYLDPAGNPISFEGALALESVPAGGPQ